MVSPLDSWPGGCEFDPWLRWTFFLGNFLPLTSAEACEKKWLWKKVVQVLVWESQETHVRHRPSWYVTLAVKVALNPSTTNQLVFSFFHLGLEYPCVASMVALRGYDGQELWRFNTRSEAFLTVCNVDLNKDGLLDCIATGRQAQITAFDPRKGVRFFVISSHD